MSRAAYPAEYWREGTDKTAVCKLCPRGCAVPPGGTGFCGARKNDGGVLYEANYGTCSSAALDPIEKKPLRMFRPGTRILSIGGFGCNMRCPFCQNSGISTDYSLTRPFADCLTPENIAYMAAETKRDGNIGVAYTYNEPLIGYGYVRDCARKVREAGMLNVLVTNGCVNPEPLEALLPFIDAANIDLKGFTEEFYVKLGGDLETVKNSIITARRFCHVEVTSLIIPGENEEHIEALAGWLSSVDSEIPLHITRFFPRHKYADKSPTPAETIKALAETAKKSLKHVFAGNIF